MPKLLKNFNSSSSCPLNCSSSGTSRLILIAVGHDSWIFFDDSRLASPSYAAEYNHLLSLLQTIYRPTTKQMIHQTPCVVICALSSPPHQCRTRETQPTTRKALHRPTPSECWNRLRPPVSEWMTENMTIRKLLLPCGGHHRNMHHSANIWVFAPRSSAAVSAVICILLISNRNSIYSVKMLQFNLKQHW